MHPHHGSHAQSTDGVGGARTAWRLAHAPPLHACMQSDLVHETTPVVLAILGLVPSLPAHKLAVMHDIGELEELLLAQLRAQEGEVRAAAVVALNQVLLNPLVLQGSAASPGGRGAWGWARGHASLREAGDREGVREGVEKGREVPEAKGITGAATQATAPFPTRNVHGCPAGSANTLQESWARLYDMLLDDEPRAAGAAADAVSELLALGLVSEPAAPTGFLLQRLASICASRVAAALGPVLEVCAFAPGPSQVREGV
jgi:hypothetical protein